MNLVFFAGKGGVGKSTNAALFSYRTALRGKTVLLNSIDPAHNLHDIFQMRLSSRPKKIVPGFRVMETDLSEWVKRYLKDTEESFTAVYKYQEAFNLQKYFTTLRYSPGLEEYAVLLAIKDTLKRFSDCDYIVFDTPPTALTLKFLALPQVNLLWLTELKRFREMILQKKEIITKIQTGRKEKAQERDLILNKLETMIAENSRLKELLQNPVVTSVHLVMNPDTLSLSESGDIIAELASLKIPLKRIIINKCDDSSGAYEKKLRSMTASVSAEPAQILQLKTHCRELTGLASLGEIMLPGGYIE